MALDPARAVNLTQIAEALPRPGGPRQAVRILERSAGPTFDLLTRDGTETWPEETAACDAIYIVAAGEGRLCCGGESMEFAIGDVVFAPAGTPRRLQALSRGFAVWRVLLGTPGPG